MDVDARRLRETQAELVLRAEELRESLWGLCDAKMEGAEAERSRMASDSFVPDHTSILGHYYTLLAQVCAGSAVCVCTCDCSYMHVPPATCLPPQTYHNNDSMLTHSHPHHS